MLSPAQIAARDGKLTASRVACLMTGDASKILDLWHEMIGDPAHGPEDLSDVWAVQLGAASEALNLDWYERKREVAVTRRGEVVVHSAPEWAACTLDGWDTARGCPIECKHVGGREAHEVIIARYQPQMHWQMMVTGATECALSVIAGASEPVVDYVPLDGEYAAELMRRAETFMACVETLTPPVVLAPIEAPVIPTRIVDMTGSNSWAASAATWLETREPAKRFAASEKDIKALVEADAARCFGHGIEAKRDRAGRLSIKEIKA